MPKKDDTPEWDTIIGLKKLGFEAMAREYVAIEEELKALEKLRTALKDAGIDMLVRTKTAKVRFGAHRFVRVEGTSSRISKEELLKLKVKPAVIEQATIKTPWVSMRVFEIKEQAGGGDGEGEE